MVENIPEGYKKTEVGIIPDDWDVSEVQDAYHICNNLRFPISEQVRKGMQGKYPYYGPTKIQDHINQYRLDGEYALIGEDGDHFLKWSTMPMTLLATGKFNVNNHAHVIQGTINETKWFYWYFYNKDITPVLSRQGAGRYKLNKSTLKTIKMPIPHRTEQIAVSNSLSDVANLITSIEKLIIKKKNIKQGAMQELFTGKKRLNGFSDEWAEVIMTEICDIRDGTHDSPKYQNSGVKFITSKNIVNGKINYSDVNYISKLDAININKRSKVDKNDILVSMIGSIGNAVLLDFNPDFCIKNVALLKPYVERVVPQYLYQLIISKTFQDYILGSVDGGIQKFVSLGTFRNLIVSLPTFAEQKAIAQILLDMDTDIEKLNQKLNKYKQIKQGMMQELLTGKRRLI